MGRPGDHQSLTTVKGIGVWTAEMFLIFALNRPDILPASDLGVRVGLRDRHGLAELPRPRDCHSLAEIWRPYRTIASWYIWKGADTLDHSRSRRPIDPRKLDLNVLDRSDHDRSETDRLVEDLQLGHLGRLDVLDADLGGELLDDAQQIGPGRRAGGQGVFHLALVAALAEEDVERDFTQERNAHRFGLAPGAATAEDVNTLIARRVEEALAVDQLVCLGPASVAEVGDHVEKRHVLDHPQHRDFQLAKHADRAGRVQQGDLLRRADDDRAGQRQ